MRESVPEWGIYESFFILSGADNAFFNTFVISDPYLCKLNRVF